MKANRTDDRDSNESTDRQSTRGELYADGGIIVATDGAEILDEADSERPEECSCVPLFDELPCWACYAAGFDDPNPDAERGDSE